MGRWEEYYLIEKLDLNVPVKVTANNKWTWQATFVVGEIVYRFAADVDDDAMSSDPGWGVTFWNMTKPTAFASGHTDITGDAGSSSLKVFSGVASAFKQFIKAKKPGSFFFSAEERSRVRLYNRFAKMIAKDFGYKMTKSLADGDYMYEFTK